VRPMQMSAQHIAPAIIAARRVWLLSISSLNSLMNSKFRSLKRLRYGRLRTSWLAVLLNKNCLIFLHATFYRRRRIFTDETDKRFPLGVLVGSSSQTDFKSSWSKIFGLTILILAGLSQALNFVILSSAFCF